MNEFSEAFERFWKKFVKPFFNSIKKEFSNAVPREKNQCCKKIVKSGNFTNFLNFFNCKDDDFTENCWKFRYLVYLNEMHFHNLWSGKIGFCTLQAFISSLGINSILQVEKIHPLGWNTAFRAQNPILPSHRLRNSPFKESLWRNILSVRIFFIFPENFTHTIYLHM